MRRDPPTLLVAAIVLVIEAAGVLIVAVLSTMDTATGRSYQFSSGVALTVLAFFSVAVLAAIGAGLYRARRWSRTPALLAQFIVGVAAITLLEGNRLVWGIPAIVLTVAGFAAVLVRPTMRALAHPGYGAAKASPEQSGGHVQDAPQAAQPGTTERPGKARGGKAAPPRRTARRPNRHTSPSRRTV